MNNTINLNSQSGNANVTSNTKGGNATSGTANAVANIVNTINSYVTAGKSFVGVININGNLNGDILLPPNFIDTLLANNVPHYNITTNLNNQTQVTSVNNATVNNNVNLASASGNATVTGNTAGGTATSGNALTNLTVFNLTGSNVVASNDMLVFVNVLGKWYGMIMNAPAGSTAAELGGGVSANTSVNNNASLTNTNNQAINNDINVNAQSGDATVNRNTQGGNAQSGNATASVNIMNFINDRLSLTGWFGLLFINVFGTWNGSFGINTAAGNPPLAVPQSSGDSSRVTPMYTFVPKTVSGGNGGSYGSSFIGGGNGGSNGFYGTTTGSSSSTSGSAATLAAKAGVLAATTQKAASQVPQLAKNSGANYLVPILGTVLAVILVIVGERGSLLRRHS
ncbi:MAG TPA: hypothetical protein VFH39_03735, partial [Candidatus Saccharimonadales bacterium]|nr:hypothetical protein [Candidatus Saccharimonadales bacterium]